MRRRAAWALILAATPACSLLVDLTVLEGPGTDAAIDVGDASTSGDVVQLDADGALPDAQGADGGCVFSDDFNRASDGGVGNAWLTKQTGFALVSGGVQRVHANSYDYRDLIVYRPAGEDLLDVTASLEVTYGVAAASYPQIHARIQSSTAAFSNALDDYLLFPQGGGVSSMVIARNNGTSNYTTLATFSLSSALALGSTYRFTLSVQGTSPVVITGTVDRFDGNAWTTLGGITANDSDPARIAFVGSVGFSGGSNDVTDQYVYDNFCTRSP